MIYLTPDQVVVHPVKKPYYAPFTNHQGERRTLREIYWLFETVPLFAWHGAQSDALEDLHFSTLHGCYCAHPAYSTYTVQSAYIEAYWLWEREADTYMRYYQVWEEFKDCLHEEDVERIRTILVLRSL